MRTSLRLFVLALAFAVPALAAPPTPPTVNAQDRAAIIDDIVESFASELARAVDLDMVLVLGRHAVEDLARLREPSGRDLAAGGAGERLGVVGLGAEHALVELAGDLRLAGRHGALGLLEGSLDRGRPDRPDKALDEGLDLALGQRAGEAVDRLAADERLGMTREEIDGLVAEPIEFTGAAVAQTRAVVARVEALAAAHPAAGAYTPGAIL